MKPGTARNETRDCTSSIILYIVRELNVVLLYLLFVSFVSREIERLSLLEASAKSAKKGMWDKETAHVRLSYTA